MRESMQHLSKTILTIYFGGAVQTYIIRLSYQILYPPWNRSLDEFLNDFFSFHKLHSTVMLCVV